LVRRAPLVALAYARHTITPALIAVAAPAVSYSVDKLYVERGALRLTDFLTELTSACPNARSIGWHERCAARFVW
jgi:hypothetical protein